MYCGIVSHALGVDWKGLTESFTKGFCFDDLGLHLDS